MNSALYFGTIWHRRLTPVAHAFRYRAFLVYLDLGELPEVFRGRWLWSTGRPAPAWFRRADHLGDPSRPLDEAVRELVAAHSGFRPAGPVCLLTHLRYWGYCMNPVSFYYCHSADGARVEAIVAEVNNTPWGERHCYVLDCRSSTEGEGGWTFRTPKEFHVSPFMPMEMDYVWRLTPPGSRLVVHMENHMAGQQVFEATLSLQRRPIATRTLAGALLRHPFMTGTVIAGIYWQALKLWLKRAPHHPHPGSTRKGIAA